ncbi:hypothetical protein [Paenibacillus sp. FSL R5-0345]|uniref:hypothetical protein n=1 Tax=Paenibacillus sp. FSL R5-0345 TaxID=1536770 RepID=UPI0005A8E1C4|nr:hypothetical protein [Paenibacillus sp. FSL R5-0345]
MATESFIEKRKRELREKNGGSTESASSFVERRKKELSGEIKTPEAQMSSKVLQDTLSSVLKPNIAVSPTTTAATVQQKPQTTQKTVDFKTDQAAHKAKQAQVVSPLQGKLPAADLLTGKLNNSVQETLKDKVPVATLINQTGGGPANASQIPGISQYETTRKEIANENAPAAVKAYANVMNYATQGNPIGQAITRSFQGNSGATSRDTTGNKTVDKITDVINDVVTPFITPTGAPVGQGIIGSTYDATGKALSGKAGQTLLKGAEKIIPGSQNTVRVAATEGIAGGMQGVGFGLQQGQDSGNEIKRNALYGAAAGGVLGGVGAALGEVGSALLQRFSKSFPETSSNIEVLPPQKQNILSLPEGRGTVRQTQAAQRANLNANTDPIINPTEWMPDPLGLPEANIGAPTTARRSTGDSLNSILEKMKPIVNERMTPPYENPNELAKWIQTQFKQAGDEISLNEVRNLGYEDMRQVAEEIRKRITVEATARQVAKELGYDYDKLLSPKKVDPNLVSKAKQTQNVRETYGLRNKVKSTQDRYQTFVGQAAQPETVIAKPGAKPRASQGNAQATELTREQRIQAKVNAGEFLPQEDIDYLLSGQYDKSKAFPDETPTKSTYVKPKPKAEIITKVEAKPKTASKIKTDIKPKKEIKTILVNNEVSATTEFMGVKTVPKQAVVGERGFAETLNRSDKTPDGFTEKLDTKYEPTTNRGDLAKAEDRIKDREGATRFVLEDKKGGITSEQSITAQRLIDTHLKEGNVKAAEEVADALLKESTRSAQFLQSLSAYNKLSPEGVYMVAKRMANKVNETSSKLARKAEVTPQMADDIVGLATLNQKMTGVKDLSNDVVDIIKRAKGGEMLSDVETSMLTKFVDESKQFIKETSKKPILDQPKLPKDKKVRDNVSKFLDKQEEAAKARLRAKGMRVSSTPIDIWADYAVIGAAKMGRGIVKFADWSEQMVKDLGEDIRPYLNNLYEKSTEAFNLSSKKVSAKSVSAAEKLTQKVIKTKELSEQEADSLLRLVTQVDNLSGEAKRVASQDLQVILQSLDNPSIGKKISSIQTQAQLLNPKTQVRNVLGNELFYRLERISKYVSTPIDIARSKLTGSKREVTFRTHNQGKYWENFINGGNAGWRGVNINGIETQYDLASPAFKSKYNPLRYTEKALGAALRSFDNAAYSRAMNKTLGELGTLDAINNGVKPSKEYVQDFIRNADENIMKIAQDYGKYVTFQDNNLISQGFTKFKRGLNIGKDFGFGDLVLKYPKTPGALLMRALEYSPAGFLRSAKVLSDPLLRNGIEKNPRLVVESLSRAIIGTGGLSMLGYYLMDKDILTGVANTDKDIRSLQSASGKGSYQVNLSALYRFVKSGFNDKEAKIKENDLMYNYDWMQPVSVAISLGANVKGNEGKDSSKIATGFAGSLYNSVSGAINTLSEQSLLKGVEQALSGYAGGTTTDKIVSIISDVPASFIPTLSNQIKQTADNTKRETMGTDIVEQTKNKVKAKIPGIAGDLPKKYDTLGGEQTHYQDNNLFNVYANPGFATRYKLSPEARKVVELINATGDESLAPRVPSKTVNGYKLTGKEYSRFSQLQGEETKALIAELDGTMTIQDQAYEMERILTEARNNAKEKLLEEYPRLEKADD